MPESLRFIERYGNEGFRLRSEQDVDWFCDELNANRIELSAVGSSLIVHTPDGAVVAEPGAWILRDGGKLTVKRNG